MTKNGWTTRAALAAFMLIQAGIARTAHADEAADRCGGSKMKAAGKYAQSVLKCHATATKKNEAVDSECLNKALVKMTSSFDKAESVGGCVTTDDEGASSSALTSDTDAIRLALAPADDDDARACASSKMKGAGKEIASILKCYATGASRSEGPDSECIAKASDKLAGAFSKADGKGGCTTMSDAGSIDTADSDAAEEQVGLVSPVCGDQIVGPTQACEVGNDPGCPGLCSASCTCVFPPSCGDGVAELPEECDDGGNADGDGCSAGCQLEDASALCAGVASTAGTAFDAVLVSSDFSSPIYATAPPLDPARLFVVEREGTIRILNLSNNTVNPTPFLDITDLTTTDGERGLLSMAFDPDYDTNRRFYVYYTNNSGSITLARYEADSMNASIADESQAHVLLTIPHPGQSNHNGGQLAFGADGYLYMATGDGGGGGDPDENSQDDTSLLGKMLRIDVAVDSAPYYAVPPTNPHAGVYTGDFQLIWANGLRNPWRFSFDFETGDLIIADVGQGSIEEIDFQSVASTGGENYGWDIFEGTACYEPDPAPMCPMPPTGFTFPIYEYNHSGGCTSVTGGYLYRGCAMPDFHGTYFYSDVCHNFVNTIDISGGVAGNPQTRTTEATDGGATLDSIGSFGQDARGEIYILDLGDGDVYRLEPE